MQSSLRFSGILKRFLPVLAATRMLVRKYAKPRNCNILFNFWTKDGSAGSDNISVKHKSYGRKVNKNHPKYVLKIL